MKALAPPRLYYFLYAVQAALQISVMTVDGLRGMGKGGRGSPDLIGGLHNESGPMSQDGAYSSSLCTQRRHLKAMHGDRRTVHRL